MSMSEQDSKISISDNDNNDDVKEYVVERVPANLQEEDSSENERPRVVEDDAGSSSHSEGIVRSPIDADAEDSPSGEETDSDRNNGLYAPNTTGFPPSRSSLSSIPHQSIQQQKSNPFAKAVPSEKPLIAPSRWNTKGSSWTSTGAVPMTSSARLIIRPSYLTNSNSMSSTSSSSASSSPFLNSTNIEQTPPSLPTSCILRPPKLAPAPPPQPTPASTTTPTPAASIAMPTINIPDQAAKQENDSTGESTGTVVQDENVIPPVAVFVPLSYEENGKEVTTSGSSSINPLAPPILPASVVSGVPAPVSAGSSAPAAGDVFVFGCNLHERVTTNSKVAETSVDAVPAPQQVKLAMEPTGEVEEVFDFSQESQDRKRKFDDAPVVTGEEEESNVIQISCRLFAFDATTSSWIERGRGSLRLNDRVEENDELQSRLIIRTKGSLRVILNTKVWAEMNVERASEKSVRITAMDNGVLRVFLIMATINEAETLYNALEWRCINLRKSENCTNENDSPVKKKRTTEEFCNEEGV